MHKTCGGMNNMVPFSLHELQSAPEIELPALEKIKAGDGI
jgi:hypothetical protein